VRSEFVTASSFSDMLEAVKNGSVDAAIANISITSVREEVVDFSQPIFDAGLQILVKQNSGSVDILSALLTWEMFGWLAMGALVLFAGAVRAKARPGLT